MYVLPVVSDVPVGGPFSQKKLTLDVLCAEIFKELPAAQVADPPAVCKKQAPECAPTAALKLRAMAPPATDGLVPAVMTIVPVPSFDPVSRVQVPPVPTPEHVETVAPAFWLEIHARP